MTHIAIVDDDKPILQSLALMFAAEGYSVETYADPIIALPKVILVPPGLLILNGRMPGFHGIDFFKRYRGYCLGPVIFLSASASEIADKLALQGLAAEAYVDKPYSSRALVSLVAEVLLRCRWQRSLPAI